MANVLIFLSGFAVGAFLMWFRCRGALRDAVHDQAMLQTQMRDADATEARRRYEALWEEAEEAKAQRSLVGGRPSPRKRAPRR